MRWKNKSEQWVDLRLIKDNYPVQIAGCAMANKLTNEPAFCWWVPYTIKKRDVIISSVKARVRKTTHKYGIEVPSTIEQVKAIDETNNNTLLV